MRRGDSVGQADFHLAGFDYGQLVDRTIEGVQFSLKQAPTSAQREHDRALLDVLLTLRSKLG